MLAFTVRRLLVSIPVLIISSLIVFLLVASVADPLADLLARHPRPSNAEIAVQSHRLGLDRPLFERYWLWIKGLVLHGNFGTSIDPGKNVKSTLFHAFPVTLRLVVAAIVVSLILAIIIGVTSAVRQYSKLDYTATFVGFFFLSLPVFWFAILLKQWAVQFNNATNTHFVGTLFEASNNVGPGAWNHFTDTIGHLILPTIVLSATSFAAWSRFQRASMLDVLNSDYMRLARAKGLSRRRVMVKHGLRTALIPIVSQAAVDIAAFFGGTVITERIFQWRGMGTMFLDALTSQDTFVLLAWFLPAAGFIIVFNLIADLLYAVLDPRIRLA